MDSLSQLPPSFRDIDVFYYALVLDVTNKSLAYDFVCNCHHDSRRFPDGESVERYWVSMRDAASAGCTCVCFSEGAAASAAASAVTEARERAGEEAGAAEDSFTYESID